MQSVTDHDHGGLAANCRMKVMIASTGAPVPVHDVAEVRSKRRALFTFSKRNDVPIRRVAKVGNHSSIPGVNPRPMHQCFVGHILSDEDFLSPALLRCRRQKPCSGLPGGKRSIPTTDNRAAEEERSVVKISTSRDHAVHASNSFADGMGFPARA